MKVKGISFSSAYIRSDLKKALSQPQRDAIYELGKSFANRDIIAGFEAFESPNFAKRMLLRVNDAVTSKEVSKLLIPISFSPYQLKHYPRYIFRA